VVFSISRLYLLFYHQLLIASQERRTVEVVHYNHYIFKTVRLKGPFSVLCHGLDEIPEHLFAELNAPLATSGATPSTIQGGGVISHKPLQKCSL
jgi:hypothetical protein